MTAPRVSVVTIFLDAQRYLAEAVESVLAQTYPHWELLLVDDGSTDGSTELARDFAARHPDRVRCLEHAGHANRGKSTSRNLGIAHARGAYVTFLDADDAFLPDKLERQVDILDRHPDAAMVYGRALYWFGWDGTRRDEGRDFMSKLGVRADTLHRPPTLLAHYLHDGGSVPCICSVLARRDRVLGVGGFDESIQHLYEDQVLLAKLCLMAPVYVESGCHERYRQHAASSTAAAIRSGEYDPLAPNRAREAFLTWLSRWVAAERVSDAALHRALRHAWWPLRHPTLHRVATTVQTRVSAVRRRLRRPAAARAVILMYHRIADVEVDPWGLCVGPARFDQHMAVLRRRGRVIPLAGLARALAEGSVPREAVVVTIDDGYADNLEHAKPVLERHDVPATVFVTSGYVGAEREFWWDELAALLLEPGILPSTLRLDVDGGILEVELGGAAHYDEEERRRDRSRRSWDAPPSSRLGLYHRLWDTLRRVSDRARQPVLDDLARWASRTRTQRAGHRPLQERELSALAHDGLVSIGAHSVSHPFLSALPPAEQQQEITRSRAELEHIVGRPVTTFAYPHGDHTPETLALVREAGFLAACSTRPANVAAGADVWALPRFGVADWGGDDFERNLEAWFRK